jgi:phosphatidylglycerophosphate synthase
MASNHWDLANLLTYCRYPGAIAYFFFLGPDPAIALAILVLTLATDVLDGYVARKRLRPVRASLVGRVVDSFTDSFALAAIIVALYLHGEADGPTVVALLVFRITVDQMRLVALSKSDSYPDPTKTTKHTGLALSLFYFLATISELDGRARWFHSAPFAVVANLGLATVLIGTTVGFVVSNLPQALGCLVVSDGAERESPGDLSAPAPTEPASNELKGV